MCVCVRYAFARLLSGLSHAMAAKQVARQRSRQPTMCMLPDTQFVPQNLGRPALNTFRDNAACNLSWTEVRQSIFALLQHVTQFLVSLRKPSRRHHDALTNVPASAD